MDQQDRTHDKKWFAEGYEKGRQFARQEADYDELTAISRARGIPQNWDIFRAEILNRYLGDTSFDFQAYAAGFTRACIEFLEKILGR
ncbi:MAG: hypothetical protein IMF11_02895 [Proteobacteria bacterium]|nr:hypothetical protein [Pseudomonadota bacterium]